jgi:PAS domain S-box-containing protein
MTWQFVPYAIPLILAASVSTLLAIYAWRRRPAAGAAPLAAFMLAAAQWCLAYALELSSANQAAQVFWAKAQYLGIVTVAGTMLVMVLEYTGREKWLTRGRILLLAIVPVATLLLVWTNGMHGLIWSDLRVVAFGASTILALAHGPAFWLIIVHSYLCLLIGTVLLYRTFWRSPPTYRAQIGVMLAGTLAPWLGNALYVFELNPFPYLDLTPFAFTLTGLAATWGLFRYQFLDVVPIARDAVIEGMGDGVIVLDRQNRIVDINPAGQRMLDLELGNVIGMPVDQALTAWSDLVARYQDVRRAHEEITVDRGASRTWVDLRVSPLSNWHGRWTGRLVVLRDITDRKRVEMERERLIGELDAFAHTVAHDLKSPLTSIIGSVHLLVEELAGSLTPTHYEYMAIIHRGVLRMRAIIDALLLLSSVRQQAQIPIKPLNMAKIVAEALQRLEHGVAARKATLILPDAWHTALGYGPWVEEVWANYLDNALKYGGTPPRIELGSDVQPDGLVRFWVRDNGRGLTSEEQAQLFVPFSRLEEAAIEGQGLGLSIVQRIVDRLGGQIAIESVVGEGSTFIFALPEAPPDSSD